jgi:flagellar basal body rod protein FlgB
MNAFAPDLISRVSTALSVTGLRNEVIASNIANRETEGYHRMGLRFEDVLDRPGGASVVTDRSDRPVSLEEDLVALSANTLRYESLARALGQYFSVITEITNSSRG